MPKTKNEPGPVFTLQPLAAPKPTWWQAHRHQVLASAALVGGFVLGQHSTNTPATDTPPAHTAPADTTTGRTTR
ncbi:hypothetical protein ACFYPB_40565 [Streptomyces olivaceoviridis]|uniref:hypothetical protein n=1 Tax=Streptomyces olivaceoviridis TaxID=1921 RepID=UPI0036BBA2E9